MDTKEVQRNCVQHFTKNLMNPETKLQNKFMKKSQ